MFILRHSIIALAARCSLPHAAAVGCLALFAGGCASQQQAQTQEPVAKVCNNQGCQQRDPSTGRPETKAGVTPEQQRKLEALTELAEREPSAAYDLALRYLRGDGVKQNDYQFVQWLRSAGERGHPAAQKALGRLYLTGLSEMGADGQEAQKWLMISASQGDKEAKELMQIATTMRNQQQADYRWRTRLRDYYHPYWYGRFHYGWRWNSGRWAINPYYRDVRIVLPSVY